MPTVTSILAFNFSTDSAYKLVRHELACLNLAQHFQRIITFPPHM